MDNSEINHKKFKDMINRQIINKSNLHKMRGDAGWQN